MAIQIVPADRHLYTSSTNFLASNSPYSISVWINAVWNGGARLSFVGMYDGNLIGGTTTGLQIGTGLGAGEVTCWTYGGATIVESAAGVMTAFNNTWTMITYTYDGTSNRVYRNGTLLGTSTTAPVVGTFTQIYINGYPPTGNASETATYQVDSYAYYGRTLSIDEIITIHSSQGTRHNIVDKLIARYDFDELPQGSTASNVIDLSGNGNTMLNTGAGTAITYTYTNTVANSNLRPVQ
jgi:hypothetical protein